MRRTALLALLFLAFALRVFRIEAQSYWIDEAWTVHFIRLPVGELWHLLGTAEIHPPLYYTPLHFWYLLGGDGEFFLRYFSLFNSVLAVVFTYQLGKQIGGFQVGWLSGLLLTVAPFQIWYAQEARMYASLMAAAACNLYCFVRLIKLRDTPASSRRSRFRWTLFYALSLAWAILTHYHGLFLLGLEGLTCLWLWLRSREAWRIYVAWASGVLLALLLCAPWLLYSGNFLLHHHSWITQPTLPDALLRSAVANSVGDHFSPALAWFPALVYSLLLGVGLWAAYSHSKQGWRRGEACVFLLCATIVPVLVAWFYGEIRTTLFYERYLIFTEIGFVVAVAIALHWIAGTVGQFVRPLRDPILTLLTSGCLLCCAWALNLYYFDPAYAREDWRSVAEEVNAFAQPDAAVIVTGDGGEQAFTHYWRGSQQFYNDFNTPTPSVQQTEERMAQILARHQQIWYLPYGLPIDDTIKAWLNQHSFPAWGGWFGSKRLEVYAAPSAEPMHSSAPAISFADADPPETAVQLKRVELPAAAIPAGELLPLRTVWQIDTPLQRNLQLSLHLLAASGVRYAQSEWPPLTNGKPLSQWEIGQPQVDQRSLWIPADTPPGTYTLQAVLFDSESGQAVGEPREIAQVEVAASSLVPPSALYDIEHRLHVALDGINLIGYAAPEQVRPGNQLWLWLYFEADPHVAGPPRDRMLQLTLKPSLTSDDSPVARQLSQWVGDLSQWLPGQVRRAYAELPIDAQVDASNVQVQLSSSTATAPLGVTLPPIAVEVRKRSFSLPSMQQKSSAHFGSPALIALLGYDLSAEPFAAGDTLPVTFYWQQQGMMQLNYKVFVQLLNASGQLVAQVDQQPQQGEAPTSSWLTNEVVADPYRLPLPADLPPGTYRLIVGFYDADTGARLPVAANADYIEVSTIHLSK